jgi:hypothetical protein
MLYLDGERAAAWHKAACGLVRCSSRSSTLRQERVVGHQATLSRPT